METLMHYGVPRRSGRYPWGSGERPYQGLTSMQRTGIKKKDRKRSKDVYDDFMNALDTPSESQKSFL